jgi:tetratricopeptide (TPR) repeat protein
LRRHVFLLGALAALAPGLMYIAVPALLTLGLPGAAVCEEVTRQMRDTTLRDVESLTRYGNYDMALKRLEWLYANLPEDEVVVVAFFDYLVEREMYPRAREVMETYLEFRPTYVGGMAKLADLYFKMGDTEAAAALLKTFIETGHNRGWAYETAAQAYLNAGKPEGALAVVREARQFHKNDHMLFDQAAQAYMRTGRYAEAAEEYIRAVEGNLLTADAAQARILAITAEPGAREAVVPVLEQAADAGRAGLVPLTVLWHLSMAGGDCPGGLREVTRIVEADPKLIGLVINAAREFESSGCYGECAGAYGLAARLSKVKDDIPEYLLARGMCEERSGDLEAALATYADFADKYSDSNRAFDAYFSLARVLRAMGRWDDAIVEADQAIAVQSAGKNARKAVLVKGSCLIMLERFDEAKATYDLVRPDWDDFQAQTAYFNLGEISFYEHDFEAAMSYFNVAMSEYPGEALANDAVERLILIRGSRAGEGYAPELATFADAALRERQGRTGEAIDMFRLTAAAGPAEVRTQSLKNLIRIYLEAGDYEQALDMCKIAGEGLQSYWSPVALETAGDIYLRQGRLDDAVAAYEDVIVKYPGSVSAGDARRKLDAVKRSDLN